jgi:hypothetical protein
MNKTLVKKVKKWAIYYYRNANTNKINLLLEGIKCGKIDYPLQYPSGFVVYNNPYILPKYLKDYVSANYKKLIEEALR